MPATIVREWLIRIFSSYEETVELGEGYPTSGTQSILTMLLIVWLLPHTDGSLGALSPSCTFSASFLSKWYSGDPVSYFLMHFPPRGLGTLATFQDHHLIPSCQLILKCLIEDTKKITVVVWKDLILGYTDAWHAHCSLL